MHKVKTIGDAYVACCGAFESRRRTEEGGEEGAMNTADSARRAVLFAMAMQRCVAAVCASHGVDIGARIGVHTGLIMGGIIGTVRFHFDMWGNGVIGAMKMEEMGAKGR